VIEKFPWVKSHFTLSESDIIEGWRKHFPDESIVAYRAFDRGGFRLPGRTWTEIRAYLLRNPRKGREVA
jgi:hypothetical protein